MYQTFQDWFNNQPEMGATGQGWAIQLWKKKRNGDIKPLTLHSNHLGVEGYVNGSNIVKLTTDFLPDRTPVIISKFYYAGHSINPRLSKVYWYNPHCCFNADGTRSETAGPNPYELKRGKLYFMWRKVDGVEWTPVFEKQMPGFLANINAGNAAATYQGHTTSQHIGATQIEDTLSSDPYISNKLVYETYLKWIAIIVAIVIVLMLLVKFVF